MKKLKLLKKIKGVCFDFDGVFTNNLVIVSDTGQESVVCNRSDGLGLSMLHNLGISLAIISTEINPVVKMRANKLKIDCYSGCKDKLIEINKLAKEWELSLEDIAYLGNDINDLACLKAVGFPVAVADAYPEIKEAALIILRKKGGDGAVREFCEIVYKANKEQGETII